MKQIGLHFPQRASQRCPKREVAANESYDARSLHGPVVRRRIHSLTDGSRSRQMLALVSSQPCYERQPMPPSMERLHQAEQRLPPGVTDRGGGELLIGNQNVSHA